MPMYIRLILFIQLNLKTPMIYIQESKENLQILEFQGTFENLDLFDGKLDTSSLLMNFKDFTLQGRLIKRDYTLIEIVEEEIKVLARTDDVILFDQPPRFKLHKP